MNKIINNKEKFLIKLKKDGYSLLYAIEEFKNEKELVLSVVKKNGIGLKYASDELKNDKEVVLAAVQQYEPSLFFASDELKNILDKNNPINALKELIQIEQDKKNLELNIVQFNIKNNKKLSLKI